MLLILSGSYISAEMQSEFGRIPPVFLPLAGQPLLKYQIEALQERAIFVALPSTYELSCAESRLIEDYEVEVIRVSEGLSLRECFVDCLNYFDEYKGPITVLFGDTLVTPENTLINCVGISKGLVGFHWSVFHEQSRTFSRNQYLDQESLVLNGYFRFKRLSVVQNAFRGSGLSFVDTINQLVKESKIQAVEIESWLDFGHLHSYFSSRKNFTSERVFNSLIYRNGYFVKSAIDNKKINAERSWFEALGEPLKIFVPATYSDGDNSYGTEYLYSLPLSELYLSCRLGAGVWSRIMRSCFDFLDKLHSSSFNDSSASFSLTKKTEDRVALLPKNIKSKINEALDFHGQSFESLIASADQLFPAHLASRNFIHGDFCFSNIIYDFRTNRVKVIDPRGCDFNGQQTVFGDPIYDYAKLAHSCVGRYDDLVALRFDKNSLLSNYSLEFLYAVDSDTISNSFNQELRSQNIDLKAVYGVMIHLFLSMIPLHSDSYERQLAFALNALRLSREVDYL